MAQIANEKLAIALEKAANVAVNNIVQTKMLTERHRNLLVKQGFLKPVIRGWYMLDADITTTEAGESALWFDSIWGFIGQYLKELFDEEYWLSPESSLDLLTSNNALPKQIIVYAQSSTRIINLPHNMSLLIINSTKTAYKLEKIAGVNTISVEGVLASISPSAYTRNSISLQIALGLADISELAGAFEHTRNASAVGRTLGALKALGQAEDYQRLKRIVEGIGFLELDENNPFEQPVIQIGASHKENPAAIRVRALWQSLRDEVERVFTDVSPSFDFMSRPLQDTFKDMEELYVQDAYHSLSIEGYRVTPELIEKVRGGNWHPELTAQDKESKDSLAARGYFEAFGAVKSSLEAMHEQKTGSLSYAVSIGITDWYTSLFQPCVAAGIIAAKDIAGYRKGPVYIRTSRHAPPADIYLRDCMDALKILIEEEPSDIVKAILGHLCLGYIHPFPDGNGRTARFLMNFLLTLGGYDWTIVRLEDRTNYLNSLEQASIEHVAIPFAEFVSMSMRKTTEQKGK